MSQRSEVRGQRSEVRGQRFVLSTQYSVALSPPSPTLSHPHTPIPQPPEAPMSTTNTTNGTQHERLHQTEWTEDEQRREDHLWAEIDNHLHADISPGRERPPSHRDLDVFHQHVIRHRKERDVAAEFNLKQGQVSRICSKVRRWLGKATAEQQGLPAGIEGLRSQVNIHVRQ